MSETTNLKLFKHDNPSTNTDKFDVDKALNENWDKTDNFAGEVNNQFEEIREKNITQDQELENLKSENQRLREDIDNVIPIVSGSGESITLNKTSKARFKKLEVKGNSEQDSYRGKNLVNVHETPTSDFSDLSNVNISDDDFVTYENTSGYKNVFFNTFEVEPNTKYYSYLEEGKKTTTPVVLIYQFDENNNRISLSYEKNSFLTTKNNAKYIKYGLTTNGQNTTGKFTARPMIVKSDSIDTNYEPYVGGQASPNPEYKQEVRSVGDNVNLYNEETMHLTSGLWVNPNTGKVVTNTSGWYVVVPIEGGKTYTISKKNNSTSSGIYKLGVATTSIIPANDVQQLDLWTEVYNKNKITINTNNSANYLFVGLLGSANPTEEDKLLALEELKVEQNPTATPYSKYGQGNANVKVENKNKLNKDKIQIGKYFNVNSTDETLISSGNTLTTEWIPCKPNTTYIISGGYDRSRWQTKSKKGEITYIGDNMRQITTNDEACYFRCYYYASYQPTLGIIPDVQIEEGSTSTNYIEHEEQTFTIPTQQPMRKIEDYQDTFVKQNNKWYEKHLIKEVILNGTENWAAWGVSPQFNTKAYVCRNFPSAIESANQYAGCKYLSDSFLFSESNSYDYDKEILFINENNACGIRLDTDKVSDLASFKEYLSNNNIAVYITLKEPTYIECTQEQSDILDEIENTAHSYEGTTHISSTDEISPIFEVEALVSLKALFEEVGS